MTVKKRMTNREIANNVVIMAQLNETDKLGYAIAWNLRHMQDTGKEFLDARDAAVKKYGKPINEAMGRWDTNGVEDKIEKELAPIADIEHEVDVFQVSPETFMGGKLTSTVMANLFWMVDESSEEEPAEQEEDKEDKKKKKESKD